jgi:hypothetical protein
MDIDLELYNGKTFKDLCKDICVNQEDRQQQIEVFISDLRSLIKTPTDALMLVPLIKQYIDAGISNDESLVKLATICQRLITAQPSSESSGGMMGLTEEEKKELMSSINDLHQADSVVVKTISEVKKEE